MAATSFLLKWKTSVKPQLRRRTSTVSRQFGGSNAATLRASLRGLLQTGWPEPNTTQQPNKVLAQMGCPMNCTVS